ncbi:MAG TPA: hypothetical protein VHG51_04300 [Longimicrobiaceae bacterium]|nr:hypothetical protein [Longimicrobiaceae bacterium]
MTSTAARPKKRPLRAAADLLVPLLAGAAVGVLGAALLPEMVPDVELGRGEKVVAVAGLFVLLPLVIAAHEAGHLLGGRLAGFRALLFVVGPLRVERHGDGFRAGWNRSAAIAGGLAVSVPEDTRDLRRRTALLVAGGPVTSLLAGAAALAMRAPLGLDALPRDAGFAAYLASMALLLGGVTSLGIGAATLIPARTGGFYSDGARLLRLLRGGPDTGREVAILTLMALSMAGRRPREWDPALVAQAASLADGTPFDAVGRQLAHAGALDLGEVEEARRQLEAALELEEVLPPVARPGLLLQAAWFAAVHDGDAARARALFGRAGAGLMVPPHSRLLAEAAVLLAEGDAARAAGLLDRAEAQLDRALDRGGAAVDRERIRELRARAMGGAESEHAGASA